MDRNSLMAQARQASLDAWAEAQRKWQQEQYKNVPLVAEARQNQNNNAVAGASGVGGVGSPALPRAIKISANTAAVTYVDPVTDIIKIFVVDYDNPENLVFSEELDTKINATAYNNYGFTSMLAGKGWLYYAAGIGIPTTVLFIDAGANLIDKAVCATGTNYSTFSSDAIVSGVTYTDAEDGAVKIKWWSGDTIYTNTFENVDNNFVYIDWFSGDDCTLDGTFTCYYFDTVLNKERVYLVNAYTGIVTEITDLVTYKGEGNYDNGICQLGNFMFVNFQIPYSNTLLGYYTDGEDYLQLNTINTDIKIGDLVSGTGDIQGNTYVTDIVGSIVYLSNPVTGSAVDVNIDFNAQRMELLRIIKTDGSYIDFDTSSYHAWDTYNWSFIGTGKLVIQYSATEGQYTAVPDTILMYNGASDAIYTTTIDRLTYQETTWLYNNRKYLFNDSNSSPAGTEVFCAVVYDYETYDGSMERWNSGKFIWTNPETGEIYTHTVAIGVDNANVASDGGSVYTQGTYPSVASTTTFGSGIGATFRVAVNVSGAITSVTPVNPGTGYKDGDQAIILGTALGGTSPAQDVTISLGANSFGWGDWGSPSNPAMFFVNSSTSDKVQILMLNGSTGTADYVDTTTLYVDAGDYFDVVPLGDEYIFFTYYDNSRIDDVQFWGIWNIANESWLNDDWFWTTTDNGWGTNYDTFYMADYTEDVTYWWNTKLGATNTLPQQIPGATAYQNTQRANDWGADYVDFHDTGTTLLVIDTTTAFIITSDSEEPGQLNLNGDLDNYQFFNQYTIYNLWQNALDSNKWVVDAYDTFGNLVLTVDTGFSNISTWYVINNRVFLLQETETANVYIITAISANSVNVKTFASTNFNYAFNDWAFD